MMAETRDQATKSNESIGADGELPRRRFRELAHEAHARRGVFVTRHGEFNTPNFMPVGTRASVKGVDVERLKEIGTEITLVNTYHLWLRPGAEIVRDLGGIHRFCGWSGPILSDSGGFQVFSLRGLRTVNEEGVTFRSHLDGSTQFLSPEKSIEIQEALGVDIAMAFDECPAAGLCGADLERSLDLTLRWAARSLGARRDTRMSLFGITQGGVEPELRRRSAAAIAELGFDGHAIGGLSVGEEKARMYEVLSYHVQQLPAEKIRYLMGVGTPEDLVHAVSEGVDLFDCVMPTRAGRFGRAFVNDDPPFLNIKNSRFARDEAALDADCRCVACRNYSRAYLHHLFKVGEMLGPSVLAIHNLRHYLSLMAEIRGAIESATFAALYRKIRARWSACTIADSGDVL